MATFQEVRQVRRIVDASLFQLPGVQAVATGFKEVGGQPTKEPAILVFVAKKMAPSGLAFEHTIPSSYNIREAKVPTDVIEVGYYFAYEYNHRARPAPGGISIGHVNITAGTLGGLVCDNESGDQLILSNNHVLADCNAGSPGDHIVQAGPYDGGVCHADCIAELVRFVPLQFGGPTNYVDCAVAKPYLTSDVTFEILDIGIPNVTETYTLTLTDVRNGTHVQKTGRTTQHTVGYVYAVDWKGWVGYGGAGLAYYENQVVVSSLDHDAVSLPGDSGSFVLTTDDTPKLCGLLFAGPSSGLHYIANHIGEVFNRLEVKLCCAPTEAVKDSAAEEFLPDLRRVRDRVRFDRRLARPLALYARNSGKMLEALNQRPDLREGVQAIVQDVGNTIRNPRQRLDKKSVERGLELIEATCKMRQEDAPFQADMARARELLAQSEGKTVEQILEMLRE
jgi:hypothetical protein